MPPAPSTLTFPAATELEAIGTSVRLLVTEPLVLAEAEAIVRDHLADLDRAASRFRPDSEVSRLAAAAAHGPAGALVSPVLASSLRAALRAARLTDGLVDPTVGRAVAASGYDADLEVVRGRTASVLQAAPVPGWRSIHLDAATDRVEVPAGCLLDLGATAKAHAADVLADRLATRLPGGFLVDLGGDIAVGGPVPQDGWRVGVEDVDGGVVQVLALRRGQAVATSSTRRRTWAVADGSTRHHVLDPRTGATAPATWAQVTVVAASALEANAASTAAVVLGDDAPAWLAAAGLPARLDTGHAVVTTPGWPDPTEVTS
ncbi:FAD:protein FMN transferase [Arthrobacter sp. NEB 688]|uniref:FAD:protein FMN transferase n=1 Tax=Arthrobacter sp. NEB 688 TaxID=904039 RepID=UPI0015654A0C|nr:FAD:protein FMN transferase [Arthrobacter sp. NEB 688]QKE83383.1 FAD:protein FMN transferase [Arthrobacter sp. NEB 688]